MGHFSPYILFLEVGERALLALQIYKVEHQKLIILL